MNLFEKILVFLTSKIENAPVSFGAFHFTMLGIILATAIILNLLFKNSSDKEFKRLLTVIWCIMVVGEIYHQTCFFFGVRDGAVVWEYSWYKFPFQFCATPLYILPLAIFPKNKKIRDCSEAFLMSFSLFAGLAVILYPNDVFVSLIGASIQSMIHHGFQVVVGVLIGIRNRKRLNFRFFLGGCIVFAILLCMAMVMNIAGYHILQANGMDDTFNMFYVSPYFDCTLPVLSALYPILPYPIFFCVYLLGFCGVAALVFYIVKGIYKLTLIKRKNSKENRKISYAQK